MNVQIFVGNDRGTEMHRCWIEELVLTSRRGCTTQTLQILAKYERTNIQNSSVGTSLSNSAQLISGYNCLEDRQICSVSN